MRTQDVHGNPTQEYVDHLQARVESPRAAAAVPSHSDSSRPTSTSPFRPVAHSAAQGDYFSGGAKIPLGSTYERAQLNLDHRKLRKGVRTAMHDSSTARAIVTRFTDAIVDTGLTLDCTPDADILGLTKEQASTWAETQNKHFHLWANSKKSMLNQKNNFYQGTNFLAFSQQRDGEYFIRLHYNTKDKTLFNPLQISFVDPDDIYGTTDENDRWNWNIKDGILFDEKTGREEAYFITTRTRKGRKRVRVPAFDKKTGMPLMLHGAKFEFANQTRPMPPLSNALQELEQIETFTLAQVEAAIKQSSIALYVKPGEKQDALNPLESISGMRAGLREQIDNSTAPIDTNYEDAVAYTHMAEANLVPGGTSIFSLQRGEDLKGLDSTAPTQQYAEFTKAFISHLAAARSMPYEVLLMKFNANYSASRATLILFYRVALAWAKELQTDALDPIKEAWFMCEQAVGRVAMPGFSTPILKQAWLQANWIGAPMPDIDPVKSKTANKLAVELGSTTLSRVARETNGSSFAANCTQLEADYAKLPKSPFAPSETSLDTEEKQDDKE